MIEVIKIITGEELIAEVSETAEGVKLKKPCAIQLMPSRTNPEQPMMGMFPYAAFTEDHTIEVTKNNIVWRSKPIKEMYNQYNSAFGSGLVVPQ